MLEIHSVTKCYNNKTILNQVTLYAPLGISVCLWGESGAGKSTLLNILTGMASVSDERAVRYNNVPIRRLIDNNNYFNKIISYMPCGDTLLEALTVKENILLGKPSLSMPIEEILTELHINSIIDKKPSELSSGEYKRVCFAKCVNIDVPYYLFDEPTSNLDQESADLIRNYINKLQGMEKGIIIATHDPLIKQQSNIVYIIKDGKVYEEV